MSTGIGTGFSPGRLAALPGTPLPGGRFTIEPWQAWLLADVVQADPAATPPGIVHPLFVYVASTGAMGLTWDELFACCGATAADGPMFGESETVVHTPLRVGTEYVVRGEFDSADRKEGKRTGVFDIVGFRLDVLHRDRMVAVSRNSIVYPRRKS
ncbi:hypothetical protein HFP15_30585 [Amycolatopsis sp. K13G38]|uniref:N-terminal of MaoC-like dehydratase domain-containing protein n=1 Tax=Amycolatopsis acididurans TaxID=2724524 RepID=A0ABX1JBQ0_9PSEU|nr:hypothetical protein [Amycolatopsis acididurans]NKQ57227.1 hypothetical protein [Amycolatopsis acididurans]